MIKGTVRKWCKWWKKGEKNVNDDEKSGRPTIFFKELVKKFVKGDVSQFQNFLVNFHEFDGLLFTRLLQLG
jgi:hypothetical protein